MDRYHYNLVSFIIIVVAISLNIVHVESTTKVVKYPLDWEFYLKYNPDLIQAEKLTILRLISGWLAIGLVASCIWLIIQAITFIQGLF